MPAASLVTLPFLGGNQRRLQRRVPLFPMIILPLVEGDRCIVVIVEVQFLPPLQFAARKFPCDILAGLAGRGAVRRVTEELPAGERFGSHGPTDPLPGPIAGQTAISSPRDGRQISTNSVFGAAGHRDARQRGAFQGHQLPAELTGIAGVTHAVPPTARLRVLSRHNVFNRASHGGPQSSIIRHGVRLANCERRHPVTIHRRKQRRIARKISVFCLPVNQKLQAS